MKANAPENYPMQFKDKIDEYLWKEHHILGGCCSSIESLKYTVAREVAEKLTDTFIEKAADYIKKDMLDNLAFQGRLHRIEIIDGIIEKFIKAMKGG